MATAKKKTTKKSTKPRTKKPASKSSKKKTKKQKDFEEFYKEIAIIVVFALFIFLFLSNFGICGYIGDQVRDFMFGLMGGTNYVFPVVGIIVALLLISNDFSSIALKKSFFVTLLLVMISTMQQMIVDPTGSSLSDVFAYCSRNHSAGGIIGGGIGRFLTAGIGMVGAYVVILLLVMVSLILITEKSFIAFVRDITGYDPEERAKKKEKRKSQPKPARQKKERKEPKKHKEEKKIFHKKIPDVGQERKEETTIPEVEPVVEEAKPQAFDFDLLLDQQEPELEESEAAVVEEEPVAKVPKKSFVNKEKAEDLPEISVTPSVVQEGAYVFPPVSLLKKGKGTKGNSKAELQQTAMQLQQTLKDFGVKVEITNISCGPSVTRFEMQPEHGVRVSKIVGLSDDIKLSLAAPDIRIEAPIPGKAAVGIEVPNKSNETVSFRDLIENNEFKRFKSNIAFAVGKNLSGQVLISDIAKMPHLLIAGATGSGKSVCINTLIMSILYKASPEDVKLIMIDPKVVELSAYQGIPHLLIPVVTDPKQAASALNWAVMEMGDRYKKFAEVNVRNLEGYNDKVAEMKKSGLEGEDFQKLPQIVVIIDELADLMMVAPGEVEDAIVRLSQLARAAGIHLIIATQRPSVNVITGLIKANVPSRIAFSVSSGVDSRTIIDMNGAEKLLGKGDMLFYPAGYQKPIRAQGAFISDDEVSNVVEFLKEQNVEEDDYGQEIQEKIQTASVKSTSAEDRDEYFEEAAMFIIDKDKASIASLQRVFKIGFNRAARLMDQLCEAGIVGEEEGTKPRRVLMSEEEFEQYKEEYL